MTDLHGTSPICFHCQPPVDIVWFKASQLSCGELIVSRVGPSAKIRYIHPYLSQGAPWKRKC
eukprot:15360950-Ditylum_brightwellii.AAC.1